MFFSVAEEKKRKEGLASSSSIEELERLGGAKLTRI